VSPGQAAVVYDLNNEELLCGGRIRGVDARTTDEKDERSL